MTTATEDRRIYNNFRPTHHLASAMALWRLSRESHVKVGAVCEAGDRTCMLLALASPTSLLLTDEWICGERGLERTDLLRHPGRHGRIFFCRPDDVRIQKYLREHGVMLVPGRDSVMHGIETVNRLLGANRLFIGSDGCLSLIEQMNKLRWEYSSNPVERDDLAAQTLWLLAGSLYPTPHDELKAAGPSSMGILPGACPKCDTLTVCQCNKDNDQ